MNSFEILQLTIKKKREKIVELFTLQSLQTELEYESVLIRLDFRYDNETNWTTYQNNLEAINELLRETDADIIRVQTQIELYSFELSNI